MFKINDFAVLNSTGQRVRIAQGQLTKSKVVLIDTGNGHHLECAIDLLTPVSDGGNDAGE